MSRTKQSKPTENFHTHVSKVGAMCREYADIGTPLIDGPDKSKTVYVQTARYAQPAGSIRKAIKETFG